MKIIKIIDVRWYNACADFAVKQAQGLMLLGHQVLLLANPDTPVATRAREAGIDTCEEIDFAGMGAIAIAPSRLKALARNFGADIIIAHRGESHLIGALAARGSNLRIARFRGDVRAPRADMFSRWLNERLTDGIAVSTIQLKRDYESKFKLGSIPIEIIYPGIDIDRFKIEIPKPELKAKFGFVQEKPLIGIVGRLSPVKGHRFFIEAASLVTKKFPDAQYVIAGGDAQIKMEDLEQMAAASEVKNIHFMGITDNIGELISSFDIGVVSSIGSEMICRVLLEYFAAGLPVVATKVNQISELMTQSEGGILVQPEDPLQLCEAIFNMLDKPSVRMDFARTGKGWVENRSLKSLGRDTEKFLGEVLDVQ